MRRDGGEWGQNWGDEWRRLLMERGNKVGGINRKKRRGGRDREG